jgi:hypothetical protein
MTTFQEACDKYDHGYYQQQLENGLVFQDVVTRALYQRGIVVVGYASRRFQQTHGENLLGAEIKNDRKFRDTGNLYIETAEKADPRNDRFVPSGIHREDNSWLFVIGDENTIWIFSTKYLQMLEKRFPSRKSPTSHGFLIPLDQADKYCIRRIDLKEPKPR